VTCFIEMGWLDIPAKADQMTVKVDTPSGQVQAQAKLRRTGDGGVRVHSVAIQLESAFTYRESVPLKVPGFGTFRVDLVAAGGFFAMVSSDQIDMALTAENARSLAALGMAIIKASNVHLSVQHPDHEYVNTIDVTEFYDPDGHPPARGCNAVVYGDHHVDRSPCGTGTSAKMALLHARGQMSAGDVLINEGLLGSTFEGRIAEETQVGPYQAIVPEIRGTAHITGLHRFVVRDDDPFRQGFVF
jgi:proline racemase